MARAISRRAGCQQAGIGRVQVFHATRRRPAKGTPLPCGVVSPADHHGAVGGNTISPAPKPPSVPRSCIPPEAVQRKARHCPAALKPSRPPRSRRRKHQKPRSIAAQRAEVLHPTRSRPAKGTLLPCGVVSPADHHGAVGGNTISRAPIAAQRAEVLHPTRSRPAKGTIQPCGVVSPADHHGAVGGNTRSPAIIAAQRAEVLHPTILSSERHDNTLRRW
jgi:hypothetical protein